MRQDSNVNSSNCGHFCEIEAKMAGVIDSNISPVLELVRPPIITDWVLVPKHFRIFLNLWGGKGQSLLLTKTQRLSSAVTRWSLVQVSCKFRRSWPSWRFWRIRSNTSSDKSKSPLCRVVWIFDLLDEHGSTSCSFFRFLCSIVSLLTFAFTFRGSVLVWKQTQLSFY